MKKFLCLLAFMGYIFTCLAQNPHYVITGKIEGADGMTFILQKNYAGKIMFLDTVVAVNGIFKITGSVDYPEMVGLVTLDRKKQLNFYLENREISIDGKIDSLKFAKITGSKTQDELQSLNNALKSLEIKYNPLMKEYQDANKAKDTQKIASLTKQINDLMKEAVAIEKNFIKENPSSFAVPEILAETMSEFKGSELETIINSLSPEVAKTQTIVDIKSKLAALKKVDIGQKAPDFIMNDSRKQSITFIKGWHKASSH